VGVPGGAVGGAVLGYLVARLLLPYLAVFPSSDRRAVDVGSRWAVGATFNVVDLVLHGAGVGVLALLGSVAWGGVIVGITTLYALSAGGPPVLGDPNLFLLVFYYSLCGAPIGGMAAVSQIPLALGVVHAATPTATLMLRERLAGKSRPPPVETVEQSEDDL
ncbi:MAG: hypothetical protein AB2A00_40030, partial [Myxococcota bacterium]